MLRWSEWFARREPENVPPPESRPSASAVNAVAARLAALPEPWLVLRSRRPWDSDGAPWVNFIALHPKKGIALIDAQPAEPEDAVAALDEFLARTRFAAFEQGGPPIVALAVARKDKTDLQHRLDTAFSRAPRCRMGNDHWAGAVADLLLSIPELMLRRLERESAAAASVEHSSTEASTPEISPDISNTETSSVEVSSSAASSIDASSVETSALDVSPVEASPWAELPSAEDAAPVVTITEEKIKKSSDSGASDPHFIAGSSTSAREPSVSWSAAPPATAEDTSREPTLDIPPLPVHDRPAATPRPAAAAIAARSLGAEKAAGEVGEESAAPAWRKPVIEEEDRRFHREHFVPAETSLSPPPGRSRWIAGGAAIALAFLAFAYLRVEGAPTLPFFAHHPSADVPNAGIPARSNTAPEPKAAAAAATPASGQPASVTANAPTSPPPVNAPAVKAAEAPTAKAQAKAQATAAPPPPKPEPKSPPATPSLTTIAPAAGPSSAPSPAAATGVFPPSPMTASPAPVRAPPPKFATTGPAATGPASTARGSADPGSNAASAQPAPAQAAPNSAAAPREIANLPPPPAAPPPRGYSSNPPPLPQAVGPGMPIPLVPAASASLRSIPAPIGPDRSAPKSGWDEAANPPPDARSAPAPATAPPAGSAPQQATVTIDGITYVAGQQPRPLGSLPGGAPAGVPGAGLPGAGLPGTGPTPVASTPFASSGAPAGYAPPPARPDAARGAMPLPRDVIMLPNGQMVVPQGAQ